MAPVNEEMVAALKAELESMQVSPIQDQVTAELDAQYGPLSTTERTLIELAAGATAERILGALKLALHVAT